MVFRCTAWRLCTSCYLCRSPQRSQQLRCFRSSPASTQHIPSTKLYSYLPWPQSGTILPLTRPGWRTKSHSCSYWPVPLKNHWCFFFFTMWPSWGWSCSWNRCRSLLECDRYHWISSRLNCPCCILFDCCWGRDQREGRLGKLGTCLNLFSIFTHVLGYLKVGFKGVASIDCLRSPSSWKWPLQW